MYQGCIGGYIGGCIKPSKTHGARYIALATAHRQGCIDFTAYGVKTGVSDPTRRKGGGRGQSGHRGVLTMGAALENELVLRRKDYALCSRT